MRISHFPVPFAGQRDQQEAGCRRQKQERRSSSGKTSRRDPTSSSSSSSSSSSIPPTTTPSSSPAGAAAVATMNFINKGIMSGRVKLSRIIHVKPCHINDEIKENVDLSACPQHRRSPTPPLPAVPHSPSTRFPSLTNSVEDVFDELLPPPRPSPNHHRRSRSLDRLPASGTSLNDRRNSYFDVTNHAHSQSLGSPELPPVFTTSYTTIFSTLAGNNNNNKYMNGGGRNYISKKNLSSLNDKFKTAELTFQKSPVRRRANW